MDWIQTLQIDRLGLFAQRHVSEISYAMATSFVVVVSGPINGFLARLAASWHLLVRTAFYVLVFTLGYASLAYGVERILRQFLSDQKPVPLVVLTAGGFLAFGIWTGQRKNLR
jgi:uncharacterized membrane protein (UPF0136 family)